MVGDNSATGVPSADESARPPILSQEKVAPAIAVPPRETGDRAKYAETREVTVRELAAIARQLADLQSELERVETRLDGASLLGPDRQKLRQLRSGLRERLEPLEEAQATGQKRLDHLDHLLRMDAGEHALARRRGSQEAAALVAEEIRAIIGHMAELWQRFRALQEEDRVEADIVRSISPNRLGEVNTFSWATGVDQAFAAAIGGVIAECHRVNKELQKRVQAKSPV